MAEIKNTIPKEQIESFFNRQSEITDRVALVNSVYESDIARAVEELEAFFDEIKSWEFDELSEQQLPVFLSHISFHREIIADIITEARQLLLEGRRDYIKRLVAYHKELSAWFSRKEKDARFG